MADELTRAAPNTPPPARQLSPTLSSVAVGPVPSVTISVRSDFK